MHSIAFSGREGRSALAGGSIDVLSSPVFEGLESFYQTQALETAALLNRVARLGYGIVHAKRIVDFGSSAGGPTLALVQLAESNGGTVDALERNNYQVQIMIRSGIVPPDRAHAGDGIQFLNAMSARGETCDLIAAFMLGPDAHGGLTDRLTGAASSVLEPLGHLLITSDSETMATVRRVCDSKQVRYDYLDGIPIVGGSTPDTLIATFPTARY
jgi:hypothetical protein